MCDLCTILRVEEIRDDGNYFWYCEMLLLLPLQQDVYTHLYTVHYVLERKSESCEATQEML